MSKDYIKQILRENTLLTEISINDAWNKFYSDIKKFPALNGNQELFNELNDLYPKKGNTFNRGVFMWLYNLYRTKQLKNEDFYKAKEYLRIFDKFIAKIPKEQRDIQKYKSLPDLYNVIKDFAENEDETATSNTAEIKQIKEREVNKVYEDDQFLIMIPLTERASCLIGKGTQWCTAADESNNMFNHYNNKGPLYVIYNKNDDEKYQLHIESGQLMDENDRPIDAGYFFDGMVNNGVSDFFEEKEGFWCFIIEQQYNSDYYSYSEIFHRALDLCDNKNLITNTLKKLRSDSDEDAIYTGFMYEDDPNEFDEYELENLLEHNRMDEESLERIFEHLNNIGFVSDKPSLQIYLKANDFLKQHNLQLQKDYKIDKGRILRIKNINFSGTEPRFFVSLRRGQEHNDGVINTETLLNYLHQGQLFEHFIIKF